MTKGRSTTLNERIEIVSYCIAQNKDYTKAMEKYKASYQYPICQNRCRMDGIILLERKVSI